MARPDGSTVGNLNLGQDDWGKNNSDPSPCVWNQPDWSAIQRAIPDLLTFELASVQLDKQCRTKGASIKSPTSKDPEPWRRMWCVHNVGRGLPTCASAVTMRRTLDNTLKWEIDGRQSLTFQKQPHISAFQKILDYVCRNLSAKSKIGCLTLQKLTLQIRP